MLLTVYHIYLYFLAIVTLLGVISFKKLIIPFKWIVAIVAFSFCTEIIGIYFSEKYGTDFPVYHFYVIVSFWLYAFFYFYLFHKRARGILLIGIAIAFTIFCTVDSLFFQKLSEFPSINIIVSNVLLILCSLYYFKYLIDLNPEQSLKKNSIFWVNTTTLIYFTLQVFIWGILHYLDVTKKPKDPVIIWSLFFSILYTTSLGMSVILERNKK